MCVCYYAAACGTRRRGLLMRSCRKRRRPSIVPPEESIGYLSKRCAICNMRQMSSNEITGIQMDGIEQRGWKETMRRSERSLIKKKKKNPKRNICRCLIELISGAAAVSTLCCFVPLFAGSAEHAHFFFPATRCRGIASHLCS